MDTILAAATTTSAKPATTIGAIFGATPGMPAMFKSNFDYQLVRGMMAGAYGEGGALGELYSTARRVVDRDVESWTVEWTGTAERVEAIAHGSLSGGHVVSARDAFLRASLYWRTGLFYLESKDPRQLAMYHRHRSCFRQASALFDPPIEPVSIPYENGKTLPVYFMRASALGDTDAGNDDASPTHLLCECNEHGMAVRGFQRDRSQPLLQFGLDGIRQIREAEALSQCGEMLVSGLRSAGESADRIRRHSDLLGDECQQMHRHDLALPQNATGMPEHTELEREGKPCLRRPITADDLDILGNEAVMADERLVGVRQQKQRVPLRFGQRQSCRHGGPRVRLERLSSNHLTRPFVMLSLYYGLYD